MKQSEKLHTEISKIAEDLKCSFFDAVLEFCESNQIDPEDVVKQMDDITKERVKKSSIDERMVRKSVFTSENHPLPLE